MSRQYAVRIRMKFDTTCLLLTPYSLLLLASLSGIER